MTHLRQTTAGTTPVSMPYYSFNNETVVSLFQKYEEIGFIYPAKKRMLAPYMEVITQHWERLLHSEEELLWLFTNQPSSNDDFASVCAWRQSNHGMIAQHLVSNGNPFNSLRLMLAAQLRASTDPGLQSGQNWFRPNNRYAYRIFASMYDKLGDQQASVLPFHYLHLPTSMIDQAPTGQLAATEVTGIDLPTIEFVARQYGEVFVRAEELDTDDITLRHLNAVYARNGLFRGRRVMKITDNNDRIHGVVVANRAPLGLNFSFLENRCYYIMDRKLTSEEQLLTLQAMNAAIQSYYQQMPLKAIPIVTDSNTARHLASQGAEFIREYMQSIWLREGFPLWFDHIDSFLRKIERRFPIQ